MKTKKGANMTIIVTAVLAMAMILVMTIMYNSQFFGGAVKSTGFLEKEFKNKGPIITDFNPEDHQELRNALLNDDAFVTINFEVELDMKNSILNKDHSVIEKFDSAADLQIPEKIVRLDTIQGKEVKTIEEVKNIAVFYKKTEMQQISAILLSDDPSLGQEYAIYLPETDPQGNIKYDVDNNPLNHPIGRLTIIEIEGNTLTYSIDPFITT